MRALQPQTLCPISRSTDLMGDRWSLLVIRELFMGLSRFHDLQAQTGATPQLLTARLKRLQADGLVERQAYSQRPLRYEYRLTPMGRDLMPVVLALRAWGEKWCKAPDEGLAVRMFHAACGTELGLDYACPQCAITVPWTQAQARPNLAYIQERQGRAAAFGAASARPASS